MANEVFVYLSSQDYPEVITSGRTNFYKVRKTFKYNQDCPPEAAERNIQLTGKKIFKTRDIDMVTLHDPIFGKNRKQDLKKCTMIEFKNGVKEVVKIPFKEFEKEMKFTDPALLYATRFVDCHETIVRKASIKSYVDAAK